MINPTKERTGRVLRERVALFMLQDGGVRVRDARRRQKDGAARREFHNKLAFPENDVPPLCVVKVTERSHRTPTKRKVCCIHMLVADSSRAKVGTRASEDTVRKIPFEGRVVLAKGLDIFCIGLI